MTRWALVALGAGVTAAIVALLWEIHSDPPTPEAPAAVAAKAAPPTTPVVPRPVRIPHRSHVSDEIPEKPLPTPEEVAQMTPEERKAAVERNHKMSLLIGGDVPQHVMAAAAPCYHGEKGKFEQIHLKYKLHFRSGTATLSDVTFVSSDWHNPRMEQCVIRTMQDLTWHDDKAPDLDTDMQADMSINDLARRNQPMPGPDDGDDGTDNSDF